MGSWFSKEWQKLDEMNSAAAEQKQKQQLSSSSSKNITKQTMVEKLKIETPIIDRTRVLDDDPRSPTFGINRTPIEIEKTPKPTKSGLFTNAGGDFSGVIKKSRNNSDDLQKLVLKRNLDLDDEDQKDN